MNQIPAYAYDRVSTLKQQQDGNSLEYQARYAQKYAEDKGLNIIKVYSSAESAFKEGRKNFNRMLDDALAQGIREIIFKNTDRLGRNDVDWPRCKRLVRDKGFRIHLYELGTIFHKDSSAEEELFLDNTAGMAKYWSNKISMSIKRAYVDKRARGVAIIAPIGYIYNKTIQQWEKDPEHSGTVEYIFREYDNNNISTYGLAKKLNDMGYRTAKGGLWCRSSVHRTLSNPVYAGKVQQKNGELYNVDHETYITWEAYVKRMDRMGESWTGEKKREFEYHLANMLITEQGRVMSGDIKKGKYIYYVEPGDSRKYHAESKIFELIDKEIESLQFEEGYSDFLKLNFQDAIKEVEQDHSKVKLSINKKIGDIESKQKRLLELLLDQELPAQVIREKIKDFDIEKRHLEEQLSYASRIKTDVWFEIVDVINTLQHFPTEYKGLDYEGKSSYLRVMASRITLAGDSVTIDWKKPFSFILSVRKRTSMHARQDELRTIFINTLLRWVA
jgi:DNA invertase Pin-like site-specific DNA recombinase